MFLSLYLLTPDHDVFVSGERVKYVVKIHTADVMFGGTGAAVYIQFTGPMGTTPELHLTDKFVIDDRQSFDVS